ncbi:MAG TPA: tetratricopeptide repeat protein [Candidatus Acidoferrum sp.]|nr:tetratricopeptide repeat protein [Candidatus Acidoferrum sp.]
MAAPIPNERAAPPPLFRRIDWLTFLITFAAVWAGYYLTLAPEVTLEDSGELATGSYYAGIPHPPGYPFWTIYTWLWTVLVPFKNVAWRVALGEATSGAVAAGLVGLLVSRGSSLLMESIEDLKAMTGGWEKAICLVSGFVAGLLIGYNGFMWSQSVIVEVYSLSVASLMVVLVCLLRWIYAPQERRYLYYALFFHGLCFTNHQTLIVAAMGIEVAIAVVDFRMGRSLFLGNSIVYLCGLILTWHGVLTGLADNPAILVIFHVVGICSILAYLLFWMLTARSSGRTVRDHVMEACRDVLLAGVCIAAVRAFTGSTQNLPLMLIALALFVALAWNTRKLGSEWLVVILCGVAWLLGAAFYFYMPLAGMTDPPMQWGYPRTVEGFLHAFSRGQYDKTNPSDVFHHPAHFLMQLANMGQGIVDEFNWVYVFLALVPFLFFRRMRRRERCWIIGITAIYLCLAVLLLILLNPPADRAAQELNRVFFTASHTLIALLVGYGLALIAACMATQYQEFRRWGLAGAGVAVALAVCSLTELTENTFFGEGSNISGGTLLSFIGRTLVHKDQYGLPVYAGLLLIAMTLAFVTALLRYRDRAPLAICLGLFALMPLHSIMTHWSDNEERGHWFGYWFGHDMFTPPFKGAEGKPLYPQMAKDAVLFGGTDPGRFCPTYMIFCDSFIPHHSQPAADQGFDRRDVYIITQNALADGTYLCYLRAEYNRSRQYDPPFFQDLLRSQAERDQNTHTNLLARAVAPLDRFFAALGDRIEGHRRTYASWFKDQDFTDLNAFAARLRPGSGQDPVSRYLYERLSPATQQLLDGHGSEKALRHSLALDLNHIMQMELKTQQQLAAEKRQKAVLDQQIADGAPADPLRQKRAQLAAEIDRLSGLPSLYSPERFKGVRISDYLAGFIQENPRSYTRVRLDRLLLEAAYPNEIARSLGGVYPDREIFIPSNLDLSRCYSEYLDDYQRREALKQLDPGEAVIPSNGHLQIAGQPSIMALNGLVAKQIFDHCPGNEFYVEESYPLKWMYPHLTPYGIIMKVNRQPVPQLTEDILARDHHFWAKYSERLIGNWITYDTSLKEIAAFVEKVYLRRDFSGFTGDRAFVRDDQAQKSFSKLRGAIAGMYAWRFSPACPPEYRPKSDAQFQRLLRETEFAFRQAFAFCPYNPEAAFHYVNLLCNEQRYDDALLVASTCQKLDPFNLQVGQVVKDLKAICERRASPQRAQITLAQLEKAVHDKPDDLQAAFNLAAGYLQVRQTNQALGVLEGILNHPRAEGAALRGLAQAYSSFGDTVGVQKVVAKLEARLRADSADFPSAIALAEAYRGQRKNDAALRTLDAMMKQPGLTYTAAIQAGEQYGAMGDFPRTEAALEKVTQLAPDLPEGWYDLASIKAATGKSQEALPLLRRAFELSAKRRAADPKSPDLLAQAREDPSLASLRNNPEFKQLTAPR